MAKYKMNAKRYGRFLYAPPGEKSVMMKPGDVMEIPAGDYLKKLMDNEIVVPASTPEPEKSNKPIAPVKTGKKGELKTDED